MPDDPITTEETFRRTRRAVLTGAALAAGGAGVHALARPSTALAASASDFISVKDVAHGARGDGSTNDRAAIQSACNAASAAGGGVVFFPAGTYSVDSTTTITVDDHVHLVGVGRASKVKCSNENTTSLLYLFRCPDGSRVEVHDLWLDGPEALGAGGEVRLLHHNGDGGTVVVAGCLFRKAATAIKVDAAAEAISVSRCEFTAQSEFGLLTSGSTPGDTRIQVRDSHFHDIGLATTDHAIYVPNNHSIDVEGCRFADLTGYGVHVYGQTSGGSHCRVRACTFEGTMRGGMVTNVYTVTEISQCRFGVATDNLQLKISGPARIVDCSFDGVTDDVGDIYNTDDAIAPYDVTIRGCRFSGSAARSSNIEIAHAGNHSWRIEGCDFRGLRAVGVRCDSSLDATATVRVIGNTWDQASGVDYAIELNGLGTVLVEGNEFKELRSTSGYGVRCASGRPTRLAVIANDFTQDTADRSVSFAGTLPAAFHSEGNHGPSGGLAWRDVASAATITLPPLGSLFRVTGTTGIASVMASWNGREATLRFASTVIVTDGSNLKLAGSFSATADDTLSIVCDGTNWYETRRSAN